MLVFFDRLGVIEIKCGVSLFLMLKNIGNSLVLNVVVLNVGLLWMLIIMELSLKISLFCFFIRFVYIMGIFFFCVCFNNNFLWIVFLFRWKGDVFKLSINLVLVFWVCDIGLAC